MNRLFLLLFGMVTFVAHAQDTLLVEEFTMTFSSYFEYETQVLESGESYFMTIDGQYNISSGTYGHKDAAWYFCYASCSEGCNSNTPCPSLDEDNWNASITSLRPDVDVYDPNHHYAYSIVGEGASMVFDFNDSAFGDNGGALVIAIYAIVNQIEGCTDPTACNFDAEATSDDGSCTYPPFGLTDCEAGGALCGEGTIWDEFLQTCVGFNDCPSDLDGDEIIGINDLLTLLADFGTECPPEVVWTCGDPVNYHGYDYATVQIGEQCWFAENLRTAQYSNGDEVPNLPQGADWQAATNDGSGAWAYFSNDPESGETFGKLYNWYVTVDERGICPIGWHVPENAEWGVLVDHYGGSETAAIELKGNYSEDWYGNGSSGFNALPGGFRDWGNSVFFFQGTSGDWWTSSEQGSGFWIGMDANSDNVHNALYGRAMGNSIRCLKDQ